MIFMFKPDCEKINKALVKASLSNFTYNETDSSACENTVPNGYFENSYKKLLGTGIEIFNAGKRAISQCEMYNLKYTDLFLLDETVEPQQGTVMAVVTKHFGLWAINPVKVVYKGECTRNGDTVFSLVTGTLAGNEKKGVDRFSMRLTKYNAAYYEVVLYSKPDGIFWKLAYPIEKIVLRAFAQNSADAIARYCGAGTI